jgi:hypothetical protein
MLREFWILAIMILAAAAGCSDSVEVDPSADSASSVKSVEAGASDPAYWTPMFIMGKPCHWLVMTDATQEEFDDDERVALGGNSGSLSGHVVMYLNGSPMGIYTGGTTWRIEEFLEPGINKIEIRGKHEKPISIRILGAGSYSDLVDEAIETGVAPKTVAKVFVLPEQEVGSLEFKVDDAKESPLDLLPQSGAEREAAEKSLRELLGEMQRRFDQHDGKGFAALFFRNRLKFAQMLNTDVDIRFVQPAFVEVASLPNAKLVGNLSESKIIWGERVVLVWSGQIAEDSYGDPVNPYSFKVIIEDNTTKYDDTSIIEPLLYAKLDGEWVQF